MNFKLWQWCGILIAFVGMYILMITGIVFTTNIELNALIIGSAIVIVTLAIPFMFFMISVSAKNKEKERQILREVFEGSRAARLIADHEGNVFYSNHKFHQLCGVDKNKANLDSLKAVFADSEESKQKLRLVIENAERGNLDSAILQLSVRDERRWYQIIAQPVSSWAGYIHWRIDDITDRYSVEAFIREEREKLVNFTNNAPVGFFSVNEEGRFLFANQTFAAWLNTDINTLISKSYLHDFIVRAPKAAEPYDISNEGGPQQSVETYLKGRGGKTILASINQSVIAEANGTIRTNAVVHDLTSERRMQKALEASQTRFQSFFEEAPLGVVFMNEDGEVSDCNAAFASLLESDISQFIGKQFIDFVGEAFKEEVSAAVQSLSSGSKFDQAIDVDLALDDKKCFVQMHARRFRASKATVLHFIDLTDHKKLEEQFAQSQKMQAVGQLAGGVAHDFNNLLTAMIGYCDLLLLRHKPGDPSFADVSQIKQNANRAANLVRQLLAFSRQQTLRPKVLNITDTLTELSHLLNRLIGASIDLDVVHGDNLKSIKVDEGQLEQVLINLAVNARDAMMEQGGSGQLKIKTSNYENKRSIKQGEETMQPGKWVRVDVSDTGCGIPDDIKDRIFEPFFTTKGIGSGTGLGLATVFGIIRQTDGFISVDSKVGKGTTFTLFFPVHGKEEVAQVEEKDSSDKKPQDLTGSETILLVEDEDAVRTFSKRALSNKGYNVLDAHDAEAALELIEEQNPEIDLLITDVIMPGMDGVTLAKTILKQKPGLRIILISGYTEDKFKDDLGKYVHFLPKPFTLQDLASKVKEVMA